MTASKSSSIMNHACCHHSHIAIKCRQRCVEIRACKHIAHDVSDEIQPFFDRLEFVEVGIIRCETKPRTGWRGKSGHHTGAESTEGETRRGINDGMIATITSVPVGGKNLERLGNIYRAKLSQ